MLADYLFDSPALLELIVRRVEQTTRLTARAKEQWLAKLGSEIATAEKEQLRNATAAALAEMWRQFGGVAA